MNAISEKPVTDTADQATTSRAADPAPHAPARGLGNIRRTLRFGAAIIGAVAVLMTGTWWFTEGRYLVSTDNAYVQGDIAVLSPRISGHVSEILVHDNQTVRAGDPLVRLRTEEWQARLASAQAGVAQAEAAVATARAQIAAQQAQIVQTGADIANAEAERDRAAADASRYTSLSGQGWSSRQAAEKAIADLRKAEAQLAAQRALRDVAVRQLDVAEANLGQAEARLLAARAEADLARIDLDNTEIRAPFDGVVGNRAAQLGQFVAPGTQLIAIAPPPARQYVVANFKETQITAMRPGQPVTLSVDAMPGLEIHGVIDSLAPATGSQFSLLPPENATGNFTKIVQRVPVRITFSAAEAEKLSLLRPGLSVEAEVDTRGPGAVRRGLFGATAATLGLTR